MVQVQGATETRYKVKNIEQCGVITRPCFSNLQMSQWLKNIRLIQGAYEFWKTKFLEFSRFLQPS